MDNIKVKSLMFCSSMICIFLGVISCLFGNVAGGGIVIATGLLLILLSQFEIESFKMPGLEAKLRKTIVEAEVALETLRNIAVPISEISISLAARTGRMGTASSHEELYELAMRIKSELTQIKVDNENINIVLHEWFFYTSFDMGRMIIDPFIEKLRERLNELNADLNEWAGGKPITDHIEHDKFIQPIKKATIEIEHARLCMWKKNYRDIPEIIRKCIADCATLSELEKQDFWNEHDDRWEDLIYFVNEGELRRKQVWFETEVY
ncbi:hypothetical protein [Pantoea sp. App145]|uniref:hypothetical protein n=1 Tax=Pantoea sp. App145 TaxID=3071567 RepID=UPI003A80CE36